MCVFNKCNWASKFFTEIRKKFNIGENRADFQEKILRGIFFFYNTPQYFYQINISIKNHLLSDLRKSMHNGNLHKI